MYVGALLASSAMRGRLAPAVTGDRPPPLRRQMQVSCGLYGRSLKVVLGLS